MRGNLIFEVHKLDDRSSIYVFEDSSAIDSSTNLLSMKRLSLKMKRN